MKTISLRALLREPLKVKRITRAGKPVAVTDNGKPLWVLQPALAEEPDPMRRRQAIDEILDEALGQKRSKLSLSKIVLESRR